MANTGTAMAPLVEDRATRLMGEKRITAFIAKNATVEHRAREAAEWLVNKHDEESDEKLAATLYRLLPALRNDTVNGFFSYKAKDKGIAQQIEKRLKAWSAGKLKMANMATTAVEDVGRDWREWIEKTIPQCEWFLLLLPTPEVDRDWILFEAGYFFRGQGLAGRLVCLHHPDTKVVDALGEHQSVPAKIDAVQAFLEGLFHKPNWIPGMPPINPDLDQLDVKAKEIVELIKPTSPAVKACCGPHMEVAFDDASAVRGWEQLARGHVLDSNEDCKRLFGFQLSKPTFGDWFNKVERTGENEGWVAELTDAVRAAAEGSRVPITRATFALDDVRRVRPSICAVRRRVSDQRVEAIDILFHEELPAETISMEKGLAALAITLQYAVRFRYQILMHYLGRKLQGKDVVAFSRAMQDLARETAHDPRFADPALIRQNTLALFVGEDKAVVQKMFERVDRMWRKDGNGDIDRAIIHSDHKALAGLLTELADMNQSFLTVTSRRFADLIATPRPGSTKLPSGNRSSSRMSTGHFKPGEETNVRGRKTRQRR